MRMCGAAVCCEWKKEKRCDFQGECSNKVEVSELRERLTIARKKFESAPMAGRVMVGQYVEPLIDLLAALVARVEELEGR